MAKIAPMPAPGSAFSKDHWQAHGSGYPLPRGDPKPVALPPICQVFPEHHLTPKIGRQGRPNSYHHPQSRTATGPTASECVHSPGSKMNRVSVEEERETFRSSQVPRFDPSPERPASSHISPHSQQHPTADGTWRSQAPAGYRVPAVFPKFAHSGRYLPPPPGMESSRDANYYEYSSPYTPMPTGSRWPEQRPPFTPFAPPPYSMPHDDTGRYGDVGMMGMGGDAQRRKRRGKLPKEATELLRSWFVAHWQYPYPTTDEKQQLMRQTGLRKPQIKNWLRNARRRQLSTRIKNAHAKTDAMHSRAAADGASVGSIGRS